MARQQGSLSLSSNIEVAAAAPLDARLIVPTKSDLTASGNFPYSYVGMIVSVLSEGKAYMLTTAGTTDLSHWKEIGSDSAAVFPTGGTTGQALVKASNTDNDVEWVSVIPASEKGSASGIAELDANGKVPSSQLPSYVDDVIDGYLYEGKFYEEDTHTTEITPETGKIYIDLDTGKTYRWSGASVSSGASSNTNVTPVTLTPGTWYTMGSVRYPDYSAGGYPVIRELPVKWMCTEALDDHTYAMMAFIIGTGYWPGNEADYSYVNIAGMVSPVGAELESGETVSIRTAKELYNSISSVEASGGISSSGIYSGSGAKNGLYLVPVSKFNIEVNSSIEAGETGHVTGSGNYWSVIEACYDDANHPDYSVLGSAVSCGIWTGTYGPTYEGGDSDGLAVDPFAPYSGGDEGRFAPCFNIDATKIALNPETNEITLRDGVIVGLSVGVDYTMGDFTWTCAEDLGNGVYAMQSQGMTSGTWPGYKLATDYSGTVDFGPAGPSYQDEEDVAQYGGDISGINIANYDLVTSGFYDTDNWKSVCANNKGLYLVSNEQAGWSSIDNSNASGPYGEALTISASKQDALGSEYSFSWLGTNDSSYQPWYVDSYAGIDYYGSSQTHRCIIAPAFDIDSSKITVNPTTNEITIGSSNSGGTSNDAPLYVEISESLALGETSSTAYAGNKGKQNADNISDLQTLTSKLKASIAYVEDGDTATKVYSEGDLVLFKGELTKASSVISIGDTLAIGTNLTVTTLEDEISQGGSGGGALETALNVSMTTGGIQSGTTYAAGTSCDRLWHELLDPTQYPTLTAPSATLSATGAKLLETGATLATTMTITLNRGSISPAYGTSGYRAGEAVSYTLADGASQSSNSFSVTITSDKTSYQGSVSYAAGEQPKDSHGGNYSTPLDAGSVNTNTLTYEFVDALWSNDSSIGTIAKESLVSKSTKVKQFDFPAATVSNPEVFDVPASWSVTAVEVLNTLSNKWENAASQFSITDTTHNDAAGNSVAYKRYTCNLGYDMGARSIRVKWS